MRVLAPRKREGVTQIIIMRNKKILRDFAINFTCKYSYICPQQRFVGLIEGLFPWSGLNRVVFSDWRCARQDCVCDKSLFLNLFLETSPYLF
jgi:hypothetical protein